MELYAAIRQLQQDLLTLFLHWWHAQMIFCSFAIWIQVRFCSTKKGDKKKLKISHDSLGITLAITGKHMITIDAYKNKV